MNTFQIIPVLLTLSAALSILNHRTLRLPTTIGVLVFSMLASLALMIVDPLIPAYDLRALPRSVLGEIDLPRTLLSGALSLLLFAGAMQVDIGHLRSRLISVAALSILGTVFAVFLLAAAAWLVLPLVDRPTPLVWCVVLGSILAPTDPVSVVGMLKRLGLPGPLQAVFAGESLFNDGVGVVIFGVTIDLVIGHAHIVTLPTVLLDFTREAIGGGVLGIFTAWTTLLLLRRTQDSSIDVLASLALATGTFAIADRLNVSGAIAVVTAGMTLGTERGRRFLGESSRRELDVAWSLIDEVLNVLLFVLIGFEILEVRFSAFALTALIVIIPLAIAARGISVFLATLPVHVWRWDNGRRLGILTWGGLRGGISVSLALGLPPGELRNLLLPICYGVVVFTIIVQGLTIERLARRLYPARQD